MSSQAKKHNQGFLDIVNDAKSRVKEINIEQYQQMKQAGEDSLAGRCSRRQRMGRGSCRGRDAPWQRRDRARHRGQDSGSR